MYSILTIVTTLVILTVLALNSTPFGRHPKGARLALIKQLPNYKNGELHNQSPTPTLPEGVSYLDLIVGMIKGNKNSRPKNPVPTVRPDFNPASNATVSPADFARDTPNSRALVFPSTRPL